MLVLSLCICCSNFISGMPFATIPILILIINLPILILNVSPVNPCKLRNYNTNNLSTFTYPQKNRTSTTASTSMTASCTPVSSQLSVMAMRKKVNHFAANGPVFGASLEKQKERRRMLHFCDYHILRYTRYLRYQIVK